MKYNCLIVDDEKLLADSTAEYFNLFGVKTAAVYGADGLRLQQVFDNIFANSYKYADTEIAVVAFMTDVGIKIVIEDFGGGVAQDELPVLKEKFKRGRNAQGLDGAGLGLYISDYFMCGMGGGLDVDNGEHGLKATATLIFC